MKRERRNNKRPKLSNRIFDIRSMLHVSQSTLAKRIGVSVSTISRWEKGIGEPSVDKIVSISRNLDVSLDYLLNANVSPTFKLPHE